MTASNAPDIGISIMKEQDYHLENVTFKKIDSSDKRFCCKVEFIV